jgi:hypothetical protein
MEQIILLFVPFKELSAALKISPALNADIGGLG